MRATIWFRYTNDMAFAASVSVDFMNDREEVYKMLCYLGRHPEWNDDMIYISHTGYMTPGLRYQTRTRLYGKINAADVEVVSMIPNDLIYLRSNAGLVAFDAAFRLSDNEDGGARVTCMLGFKLQGLALSLTRGVIEASARDRVRRDLRKLAGIMRREQ